MQQLTIKLLIPTIGAHALVVLCMAAATPSAAQTLTTLVHFDGTNGANPFAPVVQSFDGDFYGTTNGGRHHPGTIFKITAGGTMTVLHKGSIPVSLAGVTPATDGSLFGAYVAAGAYGSGSLFKILPHGKITTIYSFCPQAPSSCLDGDQPTGTLVEGTDGNLYGTTAGGGTNGDNGTVFRVTLSGLLTTIYSFSGPDGSNPQSGLTQASDGNFYGTTRTGGANSCIGGPGCGTIFRITPEGPLTSLYSFCSKPSCADGQFPQGGLIQAADGYLYGTTESGGGAATGGGTVYKLSLGGTLTTLHSFCSEANCSDGYNLQAGVIQATDGNLYGVTGDGGGGPKLNGGTIFRISSDGTFATIYRFCLERGCPDGTAPVAPLTQGTDGNFYGTTLGANAKSGDFGTVFQLSTGLGAFVTALPASAKVGRAVTILGTKLSGATGVTFGGTPAASFTVNASGSAISTKVPEGAKTGSIQVTLADGTLTSNIPFRVQR